MTHFNVKDFGATGDGETNDLPAIEAADSCASGRGTLYFPLGKYCVEGTFTPSVSRIEFAGATLIAGAADVVPLKIVSNCDFITDEQSVDVDVKDNVTHTTDLVRVHARLHTIGTLIARGAGQHGIYFQMQAGDNLNWTRGSFRGTQCGGDGMRVENASGGVGNLNAWEASLRGDSCAVGVRILDGIGGSYRVRADSCTAEGAIVGGGAEGVDHAFVVLYDDSSNMAQPIFTGSGVVTGVFNNGAPVKTAGKWLVINDDMIDARSGDGFRAFAFGNSAANDAAEYGDMEFVVHSTIGVSGVIGRLRARGDGCVLLQDMSHLQVNPTRLGFYGKAPVAQQTGVAITTQAIHAALVNLGLITA